MSTEQPAPLLGETIGENLRRTVERFGDREALVVRAAGLPRDLPRALGRRSTLAARGLLARGVQQGDRVGIWAPNRFEWVVTQYATARIGAILVNINPAYKAAELRVRAAASPACSLLVLARGFRQADYVGDARRGPRPTARRCARRSSSRTTGTALLADGERRRRGRARRARGDAAVRRPDQHPVHLGHDRLPEGRDALAPQHPQQRLLRRASAALHRARPRLHPGAVLPLLRHGARQPRLHARTAPAWSSRARRSTRWPTLETVAGRALHVALRRADDVHRRARAPALRRVRPLVACAPGSWPARPARSR